METAVRCSSDNIPHDEDLPPSSDPLFRLWDDYVEYLTVSNRFAANRIPQATVSTVDSASVFYFRRLVDA